LDSVTLEDWGEEIFAEGVGVKWRKWVKGDGKGKKKIPTPAPIPPLYQTSTGEASSYKLGGKKHGGHWLRFRDKACGKLVSF